MTSGLFELQDYDLGFILTTSLWPRVYLNYKFMTSGLFELQDYDLGFIWTTKFWPRVYLNYKIMTSGLFELQDYDRGILDLLFYGLSIWIMALSMVLPGLRLGTSHRKWPPHCGPAVTLGVS